MIRGRWVSGLGAGGCGGRGVGGGVVEAQAEDGDGGAAGDLVVVAGASHLHQPLQGGDAAGGVEDAGPGLVELRDAFDGVGDLGAGEPLDQAGVGGVEDVEDVGDAFVDVEPGVEESGVGFGECHAPVLRAGACAGHGARGDRRKLAHKGDDG